jgi:hypothetical protein
MADPSSGGDLFASVPVIADVVNTSDLSSFSAYGVEACYRFHGYSLRDVAQVSLGGGITGQALSYATQRHQDWTLVYWIWPVKTSPKTRYERVILYMQDTAGASVQSSGDVGGIQSLKGALSAQSATDKTLTRARTFLVAYAREVIKAQAAVPVGATLPRYNPAPPRNPAPTGQTTAQPPVVVRPPVTPPHTNVTVVANP